MADLLPSLPLESFREYMNFNPWWFWGMADSDLLRPGGGTGREGCRMVVKEYAWQAGDSAGREDVRKAIARAEKDLSEYLEFWPSPVYLEETVEWPKLADKRFFRGGPYDADDRWLNVKLSTGYIQKAGVEARTSIASGAAITYTDEDGDGYYDKATIGPIATGVTSDPREVAVYFVSGDRVGDKSLTEKWRIAPLRYTFSGGNLTIDGPAWLFVRPILLSGVNASDLPPGTATTPTSYATTVDVYRRYTKTDNTDISSSQGVIIWETRPWHDWWCLCNSCSSNPFNGSDTDPDSIAQALARVGVRDSRRGVVIPAEAVLNTSTGFFESINWWVCEQPDRVKVRYLAGYPLEADGQVAGRYRELISILAAAHLNRPISGCAEANRQLFYWQQDLSKTGNERDQFATSEDILMNPFGSRRGHVYVWRQVSNLARGTGIRAG